MTCTSCNTREAKINSSLCLICTFLETKKDEARLQRLIKTEEEETQALLNNPLSLSPSIQESSSTDTTLSREEIKDWLVTKGFVKEETEEEIKKPSISIDNNKPQPGKLYCQSCIERYGKLVDASREWKDKYYVCEDCYRPLLKNILGYELDRVEVERVKTIENGSAPLLSAFYDVLEIPEHLRFEKSDDVLNSRNQIFAHHAPSLVNLELKEVTKQIETLTVMLFQLKIKLEPHVTYINEAKRRAREENAISIPGPNGSSTKVIKDKPSKIKLNEMEKMAKVMFPHLTLQDALNEVTKIQAQMMSAAKKG